MAYSVLIRRNSDGEIRRREVKFDWYNIERDATLSLFWWTEGNMGCDCNRYLEFERAGGANPDLGNPCGDSAYSVIKAILSDGTEIQIDEE